MSMSQMPNFSNMQTLIFINRYRDLLCQLANEFPSAQPKAEALAIELNTLASEILETVEKSGEVHTQPTTPTLQDEPIRRWNQVKAP